jgi:hypothetical protein
VAPDDVTVDLLTLEGIPPFDPDTEAADAEHPKVIE